MTASGSAEQPRPVQKNRAWLAALLLAAVLAFAVASVLDLWP